MFSERKLDMFLTHSRESVVSEETASAETYPKSAQHVVLPHTHSMEESVQPSQYEDTPSVPDMSQQQAPPSYSIVFESPVSGLNVDTDVSAPRDQIEVQHTDESACSSSQSERVMDSEPSSLSSSERLDCSDATLNICSRLSEQLQTEEEEHDSEPKFVSAHVNLWLRLCYVIMRPSRL